MMKKYRIPLNVPFVLALLLGMVLGNFQAGKAQSETDWTTPVNLSLSGVATNPVSVVDLRGTIHVIWMDEVSGYKYTWSTDGVKWFPTISVKFPFGAQDSIPVLVADINGSIHSFWITQRGELFYGQAEPENFGSPSRWITVAKLSRNASNFDVVVDSNGILHLAYISDVTDEVSRAGVYYRQSIIGGSFWGTPQKIYLSEYLRATNSLTSYVKMAISDQKNNQKIYISWDNRAQKRIFTARSDDSGKTWSEAQQFKGPDDSGRFDTPFNASIWAGDENVLLMWQIGAPGASKCSVFSQWSKDGGKTWGETITLFGGPTTCPSGIKYVTSQKDKVVVLLMTTGDPLLLAWDGTQWSEIQSQASLPALSNPSTYDAILLGCRQDVIFKNKLFVVGCDQAKGGDVWFLSRSLVPVDDWFTPLSIWGNPLVQEIDEQTVSFLSSAPDSEGNIHIVWIETPMLDDGSKPSIKYLRWNGVEWLGPETIIRNLSGEPTQLTIYIDSQQRVMLAWVDGTNGDLLFSWANLDQASKPSEWEASVVLPSPSQLNSSPDIVVDASGRVVVAYAVPLNENRGVYLVQSTDNGFTWSPYFRVFDGVLSEWDVIDSPKITLSGDGKLHILFTRQSLRQGQPVGLYYLQSQDGGATWSDPQNVSESAISWSDIVAYDDQTVHRLWQEDNGLVVANLSQVSQDGGTSWGKLLDITDVAEQSSPVTLATNSQGQLSFIQLKIENFAGAGDDILTLHDWKWDGSRWNPETTRELVFKGRGEYAVTAGITSENFLGVSLSAEYRNVTGTLQNEVISFSRFRDVSNNQSRGAVAVIPTSLLPSESPIAFPGSSPVPTVNSAVLFESNDPSEGMTKNLVGVALIGVTAIAAFLLLIRRRSSVQK